MATAAPAIGPQRLGHVNMFVSDLGASSAFYSEVAGIELVRREPGISMVFHSNGNTHHDVGLAQVLPGERLGIGGFEQVSSNRGSRPGLNHLGWEMPSEAVLIAALHRVKAAGTAIRNTADHQLAHSAYLVDPAGTYHEFYADTVERWRTIFNLEHEDLVTEGWDWEHAGSGLGPMPRDPNDKRSVAGAVFHPLRMMYATLVLAHFDDTIAYLTQVGGLQAQVADGVALVHGSASQLDVVLVSAEKGGAPGLRAVAFEVGDETGLRDSARAAAERKLGVVTALQLPHKAAVVVRDPDGTLVQFEVRRAGSQPAIPRPDAGSDTWYLSA